MGVKKYNLAEQLWVPCAVKRYTSREEMNTSVWEKTYKGNTIKKNGADVAFSIDTSGGRGASVSTDQFYKDNCAIKLVANETYSITAINNINVGAARVVVRYLDTNEIITSVSCGELPESITLTPNVETDIYFGVDISVGAAAVKETATIDVIRQSAWHDIDDFVRQNGAWVTEAIVSGALPLTAVKTTGEDILDYKIYGASGGVGDRTENLFDKDAHDTANGYVAGHYINSSGATVKDDKWDVTEYIPCIQQNVYCFSNCVGAAASICWYDSNKNYISGNPIQSLSGFKTLVMTAPINASYIRTCVLLTRSGGGSQVYERNVEVFMVNIGSTAPASYVPYGYEVDMSVSTANLLDCESGWQARLGGGTVTGDNATGTLTISAQYWFQKIIKVKPNTMYTLHGISNSHTVTVGYGVVGAQNDAPDLTDLIFWVYSSNVSRSFNTGARNEIAILLNCGTSAVGETTYVELQLEEDDSFSGFVPYSITTTPIYIGADPLEADEYVDYGEGKIYRMSGGTPTPTDPPVPLPALPTFSNTDTIINYEDIPAPSSVEIKYKRRR